MKNKLTINELVDDFIKEFVITGLKRGAEQQKEKFIEDLVDSFCEQFKDTLTEHFYGKVESIYEDVFKVFKDRVE